ncbi:DUF6077 domain-containing protein [Actinomadura viridis]|uniref:Uncharacterized protein n=1 Tax=Actinomadura viridis TaxID=58110 RepID=A0A931DKK6_9ACTN|nr:DUF6077 domain-containing protein [Actinomadura viridis]MBG6089261.1 hypothetical protein [Actinomadura viridis]
MDRATDLVVIAFAAWTLIYHLGLLVRPPTWVLLAAWAAVLAALAAGFGWRARAAAGTGGARSLWGDPPARTWTGVPRAVTAVAVVAGAGAGVAAGLREHGVPWWCAWALGGAGVAAVAYGVLRGRGTPSGPSPQPPPHRERASAFAFATAAGFAVLSWFTVNSDGDDAYFVSRSVATAAGGRIPFQDVIFTGGTTGPIAGEPPVSSIEVLAGALARLVGMHPTSFLWYVVLPSVTFLAVWAMWRLVRAWAPRWALACFAVAAVYLLWSGLGQASLGSFHFPRMWQGKAVLVSAMVPLLYVYLTRWAERRTRGALLLLAAAGVASVGLSSSAALVVPLVTVAAAGPLILSGRVRTGLGACAAMAYPLGAGAAVALLHEDTSVIGAFVDAPDSFSWVLLSGVLGVLTGCALWLAPLTARRGVPSLIVAGTAAVATLLLVPGVLRLIGDVTGAGQVMWRTMWVVPAPVLVGLLVTIRPPARFPALRVAGRAVPVTVVPVTVAAALCAVLVAGGTPVWSAENGSTVADRPSWKYSQRELATARAVLREAGRRAPGNSAENGGKNGALVLMPQAYMRAVPLLTTRDHAVNPNSHYLRLLPASRTFIDDRLLLTALVTPSGAPDPDAARVRDALGRTGVTAACARRSDRRELRLLESAGYRDRLRVGPLTCVFPSRG